LTAQGLGHGHHLAPRINSNSDTPLVSDSAFIRRQLTAAPAHSNGLQALPQAAAAQAISRNSNVTPQIKNPMPLASDSASIHQQQQQLFEAAKLMATINPGLAAAAMEQALALGAQIQHRQQTEDLLQVSVV
jgi:hypothetical protein